MKNKLLVLFTLCIGIISWSQNKDCEFDFEEKTDSTYLKKTTDILVHERVFGNNKEMIFFSLLNSNGTPMLSFQQIQKSTDFIPAICFDKKSKIYFQLENGKIITLLNTSEDNCSSLSFDQESKSNIKVITNYFLFINSNYEELKKSPISLMRIDYVGDKKNIVFKKQLKSEIINQEYNPSDYFINYLDCIK